MRSLPSGPFGERDLYNLILEENRNEFWRVFMEASDTENAVHKAA